MSSYFFQTLFTFFCNFLNRKSDTYALFKIQIIVLSRLYGKLMSRKNYEMSFSFVDKILKYLFYI
jgi:hypothetical protein